MVRDRGDRTGDGAVKVNVSDVCSKSERLGARPSTNVISTLVAGSVSSSWVLLASSRLSKQDAPAARGTARGLPR